MEENKILRCSFCGAPRGTRIMACIKCHNDYKLDRELEEQNLKVIKMED